MSGSLPQGLEQFIGNAGWGGARIDPLPGDASFRRYFRLTRNGEPAMLMHAPPPHEDPQSFVAAARWLLEHGLRAPAIIAEDCAGGWILTEDFGDDRVRERLDRAAGQEEAIYGRAVETLVALHRCPPGPFAPYDMEVYQRETDLFTQWYCPAMGLDVDEAGWRAAWEETLQPLLSRQNPGVTVLRDYHAENIMLPGGDDQGLIDFQDALVGHRAYDLVSLLQDARRDVSIELEAAMIARYCDAANPDEHFMADYARLGAQRNAKIVGIFTRLARRDHKPRYMTMIPRVWEAMERDLSHPALAPVQSWFAANIPQQIRDTSGGELQ